MAIGALGEAVAWFVIGVGRRILSGVRRWKGQPTQRAWCERVHGLWTVRRVDGLLWAGDGWSSFGNTYPTRSSAERALDILVASGQVSRLP